MARVFPVAFVGEKTGSRDCAGWWLIDLTNDGTLKRLSIQERTSPAVRTFLDIRSQAGYM